MNSKSLGIEIVNIGWLDDKAAKGMKGYRQPSSDPERVPDYDGNEYYRNERYKKNGKWVTTSVITKQPGINPIDHRDQHPLWADYSEAQIATVSALIIEWADRFNIIPENIIGHEHVSPGRKTDPGPAFRASWLRIDDDFRAWAHIHRSDLIDPNNRTRDRVKALQSHLARFGLYSMGIDGLWGNGTQRAAQEAIDLFNSLYQLGLVGEPTQDRVSQLCSAFRLIPGFDPGTSDSRLTSLVTAEAEKEAAKKPAAKSSKG